MRICVNCGIHAIEFIRNSLSAFETLQQISIPYSKHSIAFFIKLKSHDFQFLMKQNCDQLLLKVPKVKSPLAASSLFSTLILMQKPHNNISHDFESREIRLSRLNCVLCQNGGFDLYLGRVKKDNSH